MSEILGWNKKIDIDKKAPVAVEVESPPFEATEKSPVKDAEHKKEKPKITKPESIKTPEDLDLAIDYVYQENEKEIKTKLVWSSAAKKKIIELLDQRPPNVSALIENAWEVMNYLFGLFFKSSQDWKSWVISDMMDESFDVKAIDSQEKIQERLTKLNNKLDDTWSDVVKRLITLRAKSNVIDQWIDLRYRAEWKDISKLTKKQRLLETVKPGDLVLIDYRSDTQANLTMDALKDMSDSAFCHVGFVWNDKELYHSTLLKKDGWAGVEKRWFGDYLNTKPDCTVMVIRPQKITTTDVDKMVTQAESHVKSNKKYDTKAAVSNLTNNSVKQDDASYNCGEYVYDILSSVYPKIKIKKSALPESYANQEDLQRHYLAKMTDSKKK